MDDKTKAEPGLYLRLSSAKVKLVVKLQRNSVGPKTRRISKTKSKNVKKPVSNLPVGRKANTGNLVQLYGRLPESWLVLILWSVLEPVTNGLFSYLASLT